MARSSARRPIISRETPAANKGFGERLRFDFSSLPLTHARRLWNERKRYGGNKGRGIKLFFCLRREERQPLPSPTNAAAALCPATKPAVKKLGFFSGNATKERERERREEDMEVKIPSVRLPALLAASHHHCTVFYRRRTERRLCLSKYSLLFPSFFV